MIKNPFPTHNTSQQEAQQKASAVARRRRTPRDKDSSLLIDKFWKSCKLDSIAEQFVKLFLLCLIILP